MFWLQGIIKGRLHFIAAYSHWRKRLGGHFGEKSLADVLSVALILQEWENRRVRSTTGVAQQCLTTA